MDLFKDLLSSHSADFLSVLKEAGFNSEQAEGFLPVASESVTTAVEATEIPDLLGGDTRTTISTIFEKIDIAGIASRLGMEESMVNTGITVLMGKLLEIVNEEGGGLSSLLSGKGREGLLSDVGKLVDKFLK